MGVRKSTLENVDRMSERNNLITQDMSERINIMKLIFMVMVVFIHSGAVPELPFELEIPTYVAICKSVVVDGICAVAVPGFFFISGYLLFSKEFTWLENLKKKARTMLIPYLLINTFWILFFKVMQSIPGIAPMFSAEAYQINGIRGIIAAYVNVIPLYYPFWFLRELMILNVFAKLIKIVIDRVPILSLMMILFLEFGPVEIPYLVYNESLCMFALSYYVIKYHLEINKLEKLSVWIWMIAFGGLTVIRVVKGEYSLIRFPYVIIGIIFFYVISGIIQMGERKEALLWISQFTFFIFAFHEFYEAMLKKAIMMVIPQYGVVQFLEFWMIPFIIISGCIFLGFILKKYWVRGYRLICGSR